MAHVEKRRRRIQTAESAKNIILVIGLDRNIPHAHRNLNLANGSILYLLSVKKKQPCHIQTQIHDQGDVESIGQHCRRGVHPFTGIPTEQG